MKRSLLVQFGRIVRKMRLDKGLSQEKLAEKAEVHRTYIGMIERGEKNVTLTNVSKVARALDKTMSQLLENLK